MSHSSELVSPRVATPPGEPETGRSKRDQYGAAARGHGDHFADRESNVPVAAFAMGFQVQCVIPSAARSVHCCGGQRPAPGPGGRRS